MLTQEQLDSIELENEEAGEAIVIGEAFKKLIATDEYKLVIAKGYLVDYPAEIGKTIATNTGAYDEDALISDLKGTNGFIKYGFKIAGNHIAAMQTLAANSDLVASQEEG